MKESKRIISALIVFVMLIGALSASRNNTLDERQVESYDDDSLVIWYTDDNLTDYLNTMAVEFHELKGIRVVPRLKEGGDFRICISSEVTAWRRLICQAVQPCLRTMDILMQRSIRLLP